jgi:hypothetical protein
MLRVGYAIVASLYSLYLLNYRLNIIMSENVTK